MAKEFVFFHNLETKFSFECLTITPFASWDILSLKSEDYT